MPTENDRPQRHEGLTDPKHDFHEARFRNMMRVWAGVKEDESASTPAETSSQTSSSSGTSTPSTPKENDISFPVQGFGGGDNHKPPLNEGGRIHWFNSDKRNHFIILIGALLGLLLPFLFGGRGVSNETKKEIYVEKKKTIQPEEPVRRALSTPPVSSITEPPLPQVKTLSTFTCGEGEEEQKRQGFARMDIQYVNRSDVSYKIPSGCAWISISTEVKNFAGVDYVFVMDDPDYPTGKGCGTYAMADGKARSTNECKKFLNENAGQMTRVYVKGVVFIN